MVKVRKIKATPYKQEAGTSTYLCEWTGNWTDDELINYCDSCGGNYGGRVENKSLNKNGIYEGKVSVYYD